MLFCAPVMVITWIKQLQETSGGEVKGGILAWHFYDKFWSLCLLPERFWVFDWHNQNQLHYENFKGFFKTFFKNPKKSNY